MIFFIYILRFFVAVFFAIIISFPFMYDVANFERALTLKGPTIEVLTKYFPVITAYIFGFLLSFFLIRFKNTKENYYLLALIFIIYLFFIPDIVALIDLLAAYALM